MKKYTSLWSISVISDTTTTAVVVPIHHPAVSCNTHPSTPHRIATCPCVCVQIIIASAVHQQQHQQIGCCDWGEQKIESLLQHWRTHPVQSGWRPHNSLPLASLVTVPSVVRRAWARAAAAPPWATNTSSIHRTSKLTGSVTQPSASQKYSSVSVKSSASAIDE